ncbi:MAG: rhodanese-like domain-containing protein [Gammaproteobacteria bacterium]|jgi:rhodanese-related sulfurtransferase|nr:rhodanese-like domain-containing protein [Gammaproteobacteria bacterium]
MYQTLLKTSYKAVALLTLLLLYGTAFADYLSPPTINGSIVINAETLIQLAQERDDLVIIDSRIRSDRRQGYIADSISLPDTETDCTSLFRVIHRKNTPVVFYCNGPKCQRSDNAVKIAVECGYTNIFWFRGGFEEWISKQYLTHK